MGSEERKIPYLLDFYPLQEEEYTRIHPFYKHLKEGRLTTTKCGVCGEILWQPRVVCPHCNAEEMDWVDLPKEGEIHAFTAVLAGAPKGMEDEVPFVVGIVKLRGTDISVLARIDDAEYADLKIGQAVKMRVKMLDDGRAWFRFTPVDAG